MRECGDYPYCIRQVIFPIEREIGTLCALVCPNQKERSLPQELILIFTNCVFPLPNLLRLRNWKRFCVRKQFTFTSCPLYKGNAYVIVYLRRKTYILPIFSHNVYVCLFTDICVLLMSKT